MLERCPFIEDMDIRYDGEQRIIEINNRLVRFTPNEYKLVRLLLAQQRGERDKTLQGFISPGNGES